MRRTPRAGFCSVHVGLGEQLAGDVVTLLELIEQLFADLVQHGVAARFGDPAVCLWRWTVCAPSIHNLDDAVSQP